MPPPGAGLAAFDSPAAGVASAARSALEAWIRIVLPYVRDFFRISPLTNDHRSALRRAISMLPVVALLVVGLPSLVPFASLGALASAFGRTEAHAERFRHLLRGGSLLLASMVAGIAVAYLHLSPIVLVACTAAVAGATFLVADLSRLKPAGAIYYVLAFGSTALMQRPPAILPALAVGTASFAFALVVGVVGWLLPGRRAAFVAEDTAASDVPRRRNLASRALLHVVAVGAAGSVALASGFGHSYWAMMIATVPLGGRNASHAVSRGLHRILGTLTGLVLAGVLLGLHLAWWEFAVAIMVLRFGMEFFVRRHYALAQVFLTPLALLMSEAADPAKPWLLMRDRGVETLIGASAGIALVLLVAAAKPPAAEEVRA